MNILYVANEKYAPQLASSLCSVLYNNRSEQQLDVYIFSTGLSAGSAERLHVLCASYNRKLHIIELNDISDRLGTGAKSFLRKFDKSIFGRFFLCELLPKEVDKILYLDCDTTVTGSLKDLFNELPDADYPMAAVLEPTIYKETRKMLGLKEDDLYFNSGVLLIDMNKWREEDGDKQILSFYKSIEEDSVFADQDALNGLLMGRIKVLSPKYNLFSNYAYFKYKTLIRLSPSYKVISQEEFENAVKAPVIIHYAGDERPWIKGNRNPYRTEYKKYLSMTEWKDTSDTGGKEGFMLMYHAMNVSTKVFPPVRGIASGIYAKKIFKK